MPKKPRKRLKSRPSHPILRMAMPPPLTKDGQITDAFRVMLDRLTIPDWAQKLITNPDAIEIKDADVKDDWDNSKPQKP